MVEGLAEDCKRAGKPASTRSKQIASLLPFFRWWAADRPAGIETKPF